MLSTHFNSTSRLFLPYCLCCSETLLFRSVIFYSIIFIFHTELFVNCLFCSLHFPVVRDFFLIAQNETNTLENVNFWMQWKNKRTDPMEMSYLLGIAGGCLTAVLLLVCLCIYAIRARKCCFKGKFSLNLTSIDHFIIISKWIPSILPKSYHRHSSLSWIK